jgi:aspartyl/glutamyl-tRNA(Asn/Gln) amidotransferase C subunit
MISKEEVEHIAKLARLELTEKEVKKMQKDLSAILDYFNLLKNVPDVKMGKSIAAGTMSLRKDEIKPKETGLAEKLVASAPDKKDGYIKVKTIL